jgi:hypothetical protein
MANVGFVTHTSGQALRSKQQQIIFSKLKYRAQETCKFIVSEAA